jgi:hypothetical protein
LEKSPLAPTGTLEDENKNLAKILNKIQEVTIESGISGSLPDKQSISKHYQFNTIATGAPLMSSRNNPTKNVKSYPTSTQASKSTISTKKTKATNNVLDQLVFNPNPISTMNSKSPN